MDESGLGLTLDHSLREREGASKSDLRFFSQASHKGF